MPRLLLASVSLLAVLMVGGAQAQAANIGKIGGGNGAKSQPIDRDQPVLVEADEIVHDQDLGIVTAKGHVEIAQGDRVLLADTVSYNQKSDLITATGNVSLMEPSGEVMFAEYFELTGDLKEGAAREIRMLLADKSRMAASTGRRVGGNRTEMARAVYSPCQECKEDPSRPLVWQIKARRVVHDQEAKDIEYRDAKLEMFGVPVAYTPYFSHPDPTVKRRSGFLAPSFGRGKDLGMAIQVPYYYVLSPQEDVTLAPRLTSTEGLILSGEHRRQFLHGQIDTRGSLTRDSLGDVRGHIDATGRFDLNETWRAGYQVARSSDDTYLRRYGFNKGASSLTTRPYLEGFFGSRSYALAEAYSFQGLRLTDDPGLSPVVLPYLQYNYVGDPDRHGGTWSLNSSALSLSRDEGADTRRLSSRLAWTLPYTARRGDVYTLTASMRGDLYRVSDGAADNATTGRILPEATLEWRYPFVRPGKDWQQTIEPILVATAAPNGGNPSKLPNEDSRILEFNDTNLFQPNRFWGLDRVEGGPRVAYGAEYGLHGLKSGSAGLLLGQVYRPHVDEALQARSGLENKFSDYVGRLSLKPGGWFNLAYHFRLDRETLGRRYEELAAMVGPPRLRAYLDYVNTGLPPGSTNLRKREEAYGRLHVGLTPHWSVDAFHRHDLTSDGGPLSTGMSLTYDDECFTFITSFTNNHTYDRDYSAGSTIFVRLVFKTLGDVPLSF